LKLTDHDRFLALAENREYQNDYSKYAQHLKAPFDHIVNPMALEKKWGLTQLISPAEIWKRFGPTSVMNNPDAVNLFFDTISTSRYKGDVLTPFKDKRLLILEIDISADKNEILAQVWDFVKMYRKHVDFKRTVARIRSSQLDHWDIYKKHRGDKKSLARIARDLTGKTKNPNADPRVNTKEVRQ
jgi:hypothetical protein